MVSVLGGHATSIWDNHHKKSLSCPSWCGVDDEQGERRAGLVAAWLLFFVDVVVCLGVLARFGSGGLALGGGGSRVVGLVGAGAVWFVWLCGSGTGM